MSKVSALVLLSLIAFSMPAAASAERDIIANDLAKCRGGNVPAVLVTVNGLSIATGKVRVQSYRANKSEWLQKGRWINRIEAPAKAGSMTFCVPLPESGSYGIAVRHDVNGNGKTDLSEDGGGMSNNPSISIFNLGKPSYTKIAVPVGNSVKPISITMKYM